MTPSTVRRASRPRASERILAAVETLFVEHGYAATTNEMIATRAGVAPQTVYFTFRAKAAILRALVESKIEDGAAPIAIAHDTFFVKALTEPDPQEKLRMQVRGSAMINSQVGGLLDMLHRAADADETAAELWQNQCERWRAIQRAFVSSLRRGNELAAGVRPQRAIDICANMLGIEAFSGLVITCGWPLREWESWTTAVLARELL